MYSLYLIFYFPGFKKSASALFGTISNTGGGAITTAYGVNVNVGAGTTKYGLYITGGTKNYLEGTLGLGTTSPADTLSLTSASKIAWEASAGVNDTNLYRGGANILKTDDLFQAAGGYNSADGTVGLSLACNANKGIKSVTTKNGLVTAATCTTNDLTDIAENYGTSDASIAAGDVVAVSSTTDAREITTPDGLASKAYIEKASRQNAASTIGIVSTNPQIKLGEEIFSASENPRPVALSGRVQVKVNNENGSIKRGDPISVSSTAGVATKANESSEITIGTAMESFDGTSGKIIVFVNLSHKFPTASLRELASSGAIHAESLTVEGDALFKGVIRGNDKFAGKVMLPAGQTQIRVDKSWDSDPASIVLTPSFDAKVWTSAVDKNGFTINVDSASIQDENISWIVIFPEK